jgi:hypothetical protein
MDKKMGTIPIKNKLIFIGNYEEKIAYATALIQNAAEHIKFPTEVGRLNIASHDVNRRIGEKMEKVSATEMRRRKRNARH